ncbi:MAG: hypothetical protein HKP25_04355 [Marinicaulis sp.]|nr:hypothetical protein [Marinicaulis sp.]
MAEVFDFLVVGDCEASLASAAIAAKSGARTGVIALETQRRTGRQSTSSVPNFLWRRLNLQDYGLLLEPVDARVTLLPDKKVIKTFSNTVATASEMAAAGNDDYQFWPSYKDEMVRLGAATIYPALAGGNSSRNKNAAGFSGSPDSVASVLRLSGAAHDMLKDYFDNADFISHLGANILCPAGFGGGEPASALLLPEFANTHSQRVRSGKDSTSLARILKKICDENGVEFFSKKLSGVAAAGRKHCLVTFKGSDEIRTARLFFADPDRPSSLGINLGSMPLARKNAAQARVVLRLREKIEPPAGEENALFHIIDEFADLENARASADDGRFPDPLPVAFEFTNDGDIVVSVSYCPTYFKEAGEKRDWTGQDRQVLIQLVTERIAQRVEGITGNVKKTEMQITGLSPLNVAWEVSDAEWLIVQPSRHNVIGAAAEMTERLFANG